MEDMFAGSKAHHRGRLKLVYTDTAGVLVCPRILGNLVVFRPCQVLGDQDHFLFILNFAQLFYILCTGLRTDLVVHGVLQHQVFLFALFNLDFDNEDGGDQAARQAEDGYSHGNQEVEVEGFGLNSADEVQFLFVEFFHQCLRSSPALKRTLLTLGLCERVQLVKAFGEVVALSVRHSLDLLVGRTHGKALDLVEHFPHGK